MSESTSILQYRYGITNDELEEINAIFGPAENMYHQAIVNFLMLKRLEKVSDRLEKLERKMEDKDAKE